MSVATQQQEMEHQWSMDDFVNHFLKYIKDRLYFSTVETLYGPAQSMTSLKKIFLYKNLSTDDRDPEYLTMNFLYHFNDNATIYDRDYADVQTGRSMRIWIGGKFSTPDLFRVHPADPPSTSGICEFPYWNEEKEAKEPKHFFTCWLETIDNMHNLVTPEGVFRFDEMHNIKRYYEDRCERYLQREAARAILSLRRNSRLSELPAQTVSNFYLS
jgi:hypothetical protein